MKLLNKIKWILGILMVFILIFATNMIDRNNFLRVRDSVETIYKDRLLAKELIFNISKGIHEKELALASSNADFFSSKNPGINKNIQGFISDFESTRLTKKEERVFADFKKSFQSLIALEKQLIEDESSGLGSLGATIDQIQSKLDQLSSIQIEEGAKQLSASQKAIDNVELFTQIEIYILIILAILIQIIIIYSPKKDQQNV